MPPFGLVGKAQADRQGQTRLMSAHVERNGGAEPLHERLADGRWLPRTRRTAPPGARRRALFASIGDFDAAARNAGRDADREAGRSASGVGGMRAIPGSNGAVLP